MKSIFSLKKTGLLLLASIALFSSCKKDSGEKPGDKTPANAKLKKVAMGDDLLEFAYNADGSVKTVNVSDELVTNGTPTTFSVSYGADKKISELKTNAGFRIVPHYAGGELSTAEMFSETNEVILNTKYTYLNGNLATALGTTQGIDVLRFDFTYDAAGNVKRTTAWTLNPLDPQDPQLIVAGHTDYTYDGKVNPMHNQKALLYLLLQNTPRNNVTKEQTFDGQGQLDETVEYTYTYNSQNLPQSAAVITKPNGQPPVSSNLLFSYQ